MHRPPLPVPETTPRAKRLWVLGVALALFVVLAVLGGPLAGRLVAGIRAAAERAPSPGLVTGLAAFFTFLAVFLPLPAEAAAFLNGALFPPAKAFLLTWTMAMVGVAASYEAGRRFGRPLAVRIFGTSRLARVEGLVAEAGWPSLLALRLSPVMAFTAINWASGILALSRPVYYWTTAVGLLPGTYVFTVVPEVLQAGRKTALLVGLGFAVTFGLLAVSVLRVRATRHRESVARHDPANPRVHSVE